MLTPLLTFGALVGLRLLKPFVPKTEAKKPEQWRVEALSSGNYLEAPTEEVRVADVSIFLGGGTNDVVQLQVSHKGISGARDWQSEITKKLLASCPHLVIYNPRRYRHELMRTNN